MVDLEMMAAVLAALPPGARLVLLGDKDQLASVEAGAVLGELCRRAQQGHYSADSVAWLAGVTDEEVGAELIDPAGRPIGPGGGDAAPQLPLRRQQRHRATRRRGQCR